MNRHYLISLSFFNNKSLITEGTIWAIIEIDRIPRTADIEPILADMKQTWCKDNSCDPLQITTQVHCCNLLGTDLE